ncbi:Ankyrin repeat protein [Giardia duodenalis]|uniref:Ankyrin repeat protein n=1 Tax=Giardia intestinalis TaxID=5741 RepID=V6TTX1_GIAIN|nr:Ankyrin repeat protein [Giardia intestinalis]
MSKIKDSDSWFSAVSEGKTKLIAASAKSFKGFRNEHQETALILAAKLNRSDIVEILAAHEAGYVDKDGYTALMWAARNGDAKMIRALINAERDIVLPDGRSALSLAAEAGNLETTNALIPFFELNKCSNGLSALDYAARANHEQVVRTLIAEFNPSISLLEAALRQAEIMDHEELAFYLRDVITSKVSAAPLMGSTNSNFVSRLATPNTYSPCASTAPLRTQADYERMAAYTQKLEDDLREERSKTHIDANRILGKSYTDEDLRMYVATMEAKLEASDRERAKMHAEIMELRRHYGASRGSGPGDMNVVSRSLTELQKLRKENSDLQEVIKSQTNRINGLVATGKRQSELLRSINKSGADGDGAIGAAKTARDLHNLEEKLQETDTQYTKLKREHGRLRSEHDDLRERYEEACKILATQEGGEDTVKTLNTMEPRSKAERQRMNDTKMMSHRNRSSASPSHRSCAEPKSVIESPKRVSSYGTMGPPRRTVSRLTEQNIPISAPPNGDTTSFIAAFDNTSSKAQNDAIYKTAGTYQAIKDSKEKDKEIAQLKDELFNCYSADEVEKLHRVIELREAQLADVTKERDALAAYLDRYNTSGYNAQQVADENDHLKRRIAARDEAIHKMTRELCTVARASRSTMEAKLQEKDQEITQLNDKLVALHDDYMRLKNDPNIPQQTAVGIESREKYLRMVADAEQQNHVYRKLIQDQQAQLSILTAQLAAAESQAQALSADGIRMSTTWTPSTTGPALEPFPQHPPQPPARSPLDARLQDVEILEREQMAARGAKAASERPWTPPGAEGCARPASSCS